MNLLTASFTIACKHSSRRLLCLLCVFLACAGLGGAVFAALPEKETPRAVIAIVNEDDNPITKIALQSGSSGKGLSKLVELRFVSAAQAREGVFSAVVTIPAGFLDSVLTGENLSPTLEVNATTPLEAMWVRQLAQAGADYLTAAQLGVYTVQEGLGYGEGMPRDRYEFLLAGINMSIMKAMMGRLGLVEEETLSASGALALPQYYAAALAALLFTSYGFLFRPAVRGLQSFSRQLRSTAKSRVLLLSAGGHVFLLTLAAALCLFLPVSARAGFSGEKLAALLLFSLLACALALLAALLLRGDSACAAFCILLGLGGGLCSGAFLPLPLMPPAFSSIAPLFPAFQARRLISVWLGERLTLPLAAQAVAMSAVLLALCALLWNRKEAA